MYACEQTLIQHDIYFKALKFSDIHHNHNFQDES